MMKKLLLILATLVVLCFAAAAEDIMYVTSPDGLRVRSEPNLSSAKIYVLYYGEYVLVDKIGEKATIDGITANWVKVNLFDAHDDVPAVSGWVFGGYLSKKEQDLGDAFSFIKTYLKNSKKPAYFAPFFPGEKDTVYLKDASEWNNIPSYNCALENLCQKNFYPENNAITIRECMYYHPPVLNSSLGYMAILPAGTKVKLFKTARYGIKNGVLFPIYEFITLGELEPVRGYIRGIDLTNINCTSSVSDGEGGSYNLYYQRALPHVNSESQRTYEKVEEALNSVWTYEGAYLRDGYKMNAIYITDPAGQCYYVDDYETNANSLELEYPLNMKKPVLCIKENHFSGGYGGGYISTKICTAELLYDTAKIRESFVYGYLSVDAGYEGMAYHYYTDSGAVTYEYQTDEMGNVEYNRHTYYGQNPGLPYVFWDGDSVNGEPEGKSQTFKKGQYVNPVCRLKMRVSPLLSSWTICSLQPGTLLKVEEVGEKQTIDGITANWVKVEPVNNDRSVDGELLKESFPAEETSAWVFGGYLE